MEEIGLDWVRLLSDRVEYVTGTTPDNYKLHRTNGPAVEYYSGEKEYYINGIQKTAEDIKK
jgi:hypothetical protein